jgi:integrase
VYYRDRGQSVRRRVATDEKSAAQIAAQVNAQRATGMPTLLAFEPIGLAELRRRFLDHHEHVRRSSLATIRRYRAATQHLENFVTAVTGSVLAHQVSAAEFVRHLRLIKVAPNGHAHCVRRPLRDKGIRFILEVCRSLYGFAAKYRHLPPYQPNPFSELEPERMMLSDKKPIFVFDAETELRFLKAADDGTFPIHFTLAKTGLRSGELRHLLIEDLDLDGGWLRVRNKAELGWRIKTGRERSVPLVKEVIAVLRRVIGSRREGPVFLRQQHDRRATPLGPVGRSGMQHVLAERLREFEARAGVSPTREQESRITRMVWRDAGAIRSEAIRQSFIRTARTAGLLAATCPKSWRHTFATLLQDANVDPLIRQITLGHQSQGVDRGALGMTSVYTHTRPTTQKEQIERALHQWPASLALASEWSEGNGQSN